MERKKVKRETARYFSASVPDPHVEVECALKISVEVDMKFAFSRALEVAADSLPRNELQLSPAALFI